MTVRVLAKSSDNVVVAARRDFRGEGKVRSVPVHSMTRHDGDHPDGGRHQRHEQVRCNIMNRPCLAQTRRSPLLTVELGEDCGSVRRSSAISANKSITRD